jgi:hypothetical protein
VGTDWRAFTGWLLRPGGPPEHSWRAWYAATTEEQYAAVGWKFRAVRLLRLGRLLIPFVLVSLRSPALRADAGTYLPLLAALAGGVLVACQVLWAVSVGAGWGAHALGRCVRALGRRGRRRRHAHGSDEDAAAADGSGAHAAAGAGGGGGGGHGHGAAPAGPAPPVTLAGVLLHTPDGPWIALRAAVIVGAFAAVALLQPSRGLGYRLEGIVAYGFLLWAAARAVGILSLRPLTAGARSVNAAFDACLGLGLLAVQALFCALLPCARSVSVVWRVERAPVPCRWVTVAALR